MFKVSIAKHERLLTSFENHHNNKSYQAPVFVQAKVHSVC